MASRATLTLDACHCNRLEVQTSCCQQDLSLGYIAYHIKNMSWNIT